MTEEQLIKDIYQNAKMGIIGIDEVIFKIKNKKLLKEVEREKAKYNEICEMCKHYLEHHKEEVVEPNMMAKMGSEFMTQMKLFKDDSDEIIIDMMIKGTKKSIDIVKNKQEEAKEAGSKVKKIINNMYDVLKDSMDNLQKIYKVYFCKD